MLVILLFSCGQNHGEQSSSTSESTSGRELNYTAEVRFFKDREFTDAITSARMAIAETDRERQEGLMGVYHMPSDAGMIFLFAREQELSFWMANTPLPLDIIFVNSDNKIVRIHSNTPPYSQQNFSSGEPAIKAVEVNGGFAARYDIQEGHYVEFLR
ncbi:MAG: DUF192 domain-containing protein [Balneolales bacterium]|nr:DUF192 domain-containing protein [Balneolales bacterium]